MKRISLIITMILLTILGALSCTKDDDQGGGPGGGGCGADPYPVTGKKTAHSTQFSLVATNADASTDEKSPCKYTLDQWNTIKAKLQENKFLKERLNTEYNNYDFYRISVNSSEENTKYKEIINQLTKNLEYQVTPVYKDDELSNVCNKILPPQRKCPNCLDDVIAINITSYIERIQTGPVYTNCYTPSHCNIYVTFCKSKDTFIYHGFPTRKLSPTISEIIDPECMAGLSIQDGAIVFPKPIVQCIIKDKIINNRIDPDIIKGEDQIIRYNLNSLCSNDPLETQTPPQEVNNNEENENKNENDPQEVVENNPEQSVNQFTGYTKLKLQLEQTCYDPAVGRVDPKDYVPRSIDQLSILPLGPSCAHFTCTLE